MLHVYPLGAKRRLSLFLQQQGSAFIACGESLEIAWGMSATLDIDRLQTTITDVTMALQDSHSDVILLRGHTHSVIEATRGRAQGLRVIGHVAWSPFY